MIRSSPGRKAENRNRRISWHRILSSSTPRTSETHPSPTDHVSSPNYDPTLANKFQQQPMPQSKNLYGPSSQVTQAYDQPPQLAQSSSINHFPMNNFMPSNLTSALYNQVN